MVELNALGKLLISLGIAIIVIGCFLMLAGKIPGIGRLPGDIYYRKGNFTFYFPVVTSIIISLILSLVINFVLRK